MEGWRVRRGSSGVLGPLVVFSLLLLSVSALHPEPGSVHLQGRGYQPDPLSEGAWLALPHLSQPS
jgi:hypothetical protein